MAICPMGRPKATDLKWQTVLKWDFMTKISAEELVGEEWAEWYSLTPIERWRQSSKLWETYLALGGSLDPEPDTQSPFFDPKREGDFH
jgi:hypothetical protein